MSGASMFIEDDSDSDNSVGLASTVQDDSQDEYTVEKILHEVEDEDGIKYYLVKWEGYPVFESTYERYENFNGPEPFAAWEERKRQIERGVIAPFDDAEFERAVAKANRKEARRKARREEKRRAESHQRKKKRLVPRKSLRPQSDSEAEDELETPALATSSSAKKRKRLVSKSPPASPMLSVNDVQNSQFSLFNDAPISSDKATRPAAKPIRGLEQEPSLKERDGYKAVTEPHRKDTAHSTDTFTAASSSAPLKSANTQSRKVTSGGFRLATAVQDLSTSTNSVSKPAAKPSAVLEPRSKPSKVTAVDRSSGVPARSKKTGSNVFAAVTTDKARRHKQFVSAETPKDSTDPLFKNLSTQHRYRKYGVNEPPPNPEALNFVIGDTTGFDNSKNVVSRTAPIPLKVNTNVPMQASIQSSATPVARSGAPSTSHSTYASSTRDARWIKENVSCRWFLKNGICRHESYCKYAHKKCAETQPKKPEVCRFWAGAGCGYSDALCEYMHEPLVRSDTGRGKKDHSQPSGLRQGEFTLDMHLCNRTSLTNYFADEAERLNREARLSELTSGFSSKPPISRFDVRPGHVSHPQDQFKTPTVPLMTRSPEEFDDTTLSFMNTNAMDLAPSAVPSEVYAQIDIGAATPIGVQLLFDRGSNQALFTSIDRSRCSLHAQHLCTASDFQQYFYQGNESLASGCILPKGNAEHFKSLTERLTINTVGAVVQQQDFLMLIYPTNSHDWDFIEHYGVAKSVLRFRVQSPMPALPSTLASSEDAAQLSKESLVDICEKYLDLSQERLFDGAGRDKTLAKAVFLMFPSRGSAEVQLITAYLHEIGAIVYHADIPNAWTAFRTHQKSGAIIFHPSMSRYWDIAGFYEALSEGSFNMFQLGIDDTLLDHAETTYSCVRLFAQSAATLITDDIIEHHPQQAKRIFELFMTKSFKKPIIGSRNDRLVTRPGLKDWLLDLLQQHPDKPAAQYWAAIYVMVDKLTSPDETPDPARSKPGSPDSLHRQDASSSITDRDQCLVISPPLDDLPDYPAMWERDQESATDYLVQWFAGWGVFERERFRRFAVLHEENRRAEQTPGFGTGSKDPRGWSKKWQHVRVTTPNRWLHSNGN